MRRRQVLAALGASLPFAGCLGAATRHNTPTTESDIRLTAPTIAPGETVFITLTAQSVTHLRFSDGPDIEAAVEYENATFSPSPSVVWTGKPPMWQWSPPETVTGQIPLTVSETVTPGDYRYALGVQQEGSGEVTKSVTVAVRD